MEEKSKVGKVFIIIVCTLLVVIPSVMLFCSLQESKKIEAAFNEYKAESETKLEEEKQKNIELEKAADFPNLDYEVGDLAYGACGVALSGSYEDLVIDWREDPVYVPKEKTAYLTFDDGPSDRTPEILDILDEYNVKATFFVLGTKEERKHMYKEIVDRGHAIGVHSQTHKYDYIYASVENYLTDYDELFKTIVEQTGQVPVLFRFPGGSTNQVMERNQLFEPIKTEMETRGFIYYDWNVSSEDATYKKVSAEEIVENVLTGAKNKQRAVVLMHDSAPKNTTVEALPKIIEGLQADGFLIDKLDAYLKPVQFK